jgi:hypothetical protein
MQDLPGTEKRIAVVCSSSRSIILVVAGDIQERLRLQIIILFLPLPLPAPAPAPALSLAI